MLTVALIGADGAGKSSVIARLERELPVPMRRMYLGVSAASATHPLPSTRLAHWAAVRSGRAEGAGGPPPLAPPSDGSGRPARRPVLSNIRAGARITNRIAEETYQELVSRWHRSCGRVVVYDRFYPADFHAHDLSGRPDLRWERRLHGAFLRRWFAEPDLVVVLDAEPELLLARKGEGTLAELASRRGEYLAYAETVANPLYVRADRPLDDIVTEVIGAICDAVDTTAATPTEPIHHGARR